MCGAGQRGSSHLLALCRVCDQLANAGCKGRGRGVTRQQTISDCRANIQAFIAQNNWQPRRCRLEQNDALCLKMVRCQQKDITRAQQFSDLSPWQKTMKEHAVINVQALGEVLQIGLFTSVADNVQLDMSR